MIGICSPRALCPALSCTRLPPRLPIREHGAHSHLLLLESLRYGKSTPRDYAIFLAMWLLPRRRRRRLRDWMARRPQLRALVQSL